MTQEVSPVSQIAVSVAAITLTSVCADIEIRQGEGSCIEVTAQTPSFWKVTEDGHITEVGGPVAEALNMASSVFRNGNSSFVSLSTGWSDGEFRVNNRTVVVPDPRERLVIYVPVDFAGDLVINAEYFGEISIDARLKGQLTAEVSMRVSLKTVDQKGLTGASLEASMGATIVAGAITARHGSVGLKASMTDSIDDETVRPSSVTTGNICATDFSAKAEMGGQVTGKTVGVRNGAALKSGMDGSRMAFDDVWAQALEVKGDMSGVISLSNADAMTIEVKADMGALVTILKGSAASGRAKADMGGRVVLSGDFAALKRKEDMGGRVSFTAVKGDAGDRFLRAAKRSYNRDLWDDAHSSTIALTIVSSIAPLMQQGMAEALADDTFVAVVCKAMGPTFEDAPVLESIRKCGAAFREVLGPLEKVTDPQAAAQAIQAPSVAELYTPALQLFLATAFKKAEAFAS